MKKMSEMAGVEFDGVGFPYVPPQKVKYHDDLKLHVEFDEFVDPVTYEVVRHNLWNKIGRAHV